MRCWRRAASRQSATSTAPTCCPPSRRAAAWWASRKVGSHRVREPGSAAWGGSLACSGRNNRSETTSPATPPATPPPHRHPPTCLFYLSGLRGIWLPLLDRSLPLAGPDGECPGGRWGSKGEAATGGCEVRGGPRAPPSHSSPCPRPHGPLPCLHSPGPSLLSCQAITHELFHNLYLDHSGREDKKTGMFDECAGVARRSSSGLDVAQNTTPLALAASSAQGAAFRRWLLLWQACLLSPPHPTPFPQVRRRHVPPGVLLRRALPQHAARLAAGLDLAAAAHRGAAGPRAGGQPDHILAVGPGEQAPAFENQPNKQTRACRCRSRSRRHRSSSQSRRRCTRRLTSPAPCACCPAPLPQAANAGIRVLPGWAAGVPPVFVGYRTAHKGDAALDPRLLAKVRQAEGTDLPPSPLLLLLPLPLPLLPPPSPPPSDALCRRPLLLALAALPAGARLHIARRRRQGRDDVHLAGDTCRWAARRAGHVHAQTVVVRGTRVRDVGATAPCPARLPACSRPAPSPHQPAPLPTPPPLTSRSQPGVGAARIGACGAREEHRRKGRRRHRVPPRRPRDAGQLRGSAGQRLQRADGQQRSYLHGAAAPARAPRLAAFSAACAAAGWLHTSLGVQLQMLRRPGCRPSRPCRASLLCSDALCYPSLHRARGWRTACPPFVNPSPAVAPAPRLPVWRCMPACHPKQT